MNCSLPGSSVHGILQARVLEWVAMPFSRGSSRPRGQTRTFYISLASAGRFFPTSTIWEALLHGVGGLKEQVCMWWGCPSPSVSKIQCFCWVPKGKNGFCTNLNWKVPSYGVPKTSLVEAQLWHQECLFFSFFSEFLCECPGRSGAPLMNFKHIYCEAGTFP